MIRRLPTTTPSSPAEGVAAQRRHAEINGRNRTHYCGAYWGWGFHEDGVVSALRACDSLVASMPPAPIPFGLPAAPQEPAGLAA